MEKLGEFRESLKETDWAWIAGFIDGEGYVGMRRGYTHNKRKFHDGNQRRWVWYTPSISISNTDKKALEFIKKAFNCPSNINKQKRTKSNLKQLYIFETSSSKVLRRVLQELIPFLKVKKEQAKLVYRLVCLPRGSGPEKEEIWKEYFELISSNGQKAVGDRNHKFLQVGNPEPSFQMK